MPHFYGTIPYSSRRTVPAAFGTKRSGLATNAASGAGCIHVEIWHNAETGEDHFEVSQIPWTAGGIRDGIHEMLATGILGEPAVNSCPKP